MGLTLKDIGKAIKETLEKVIHDGGLKVHEKPDIILKVETVDHNHNDRIDGGALVVTIKKDL